jgi:HEAT repeat protein
VIAGFIVWWRIDSARRLDQRAQAEIPPLIADLGNPDSFTRSRAANRLANFGARAREATPALVRALEDPDFHVRSSAAGALLMIGSGVLPQVLPLLDSDNHETVLTALDLVGSFESASVAAVPALLRLVGSSDLRVASRAESALRGVGEPALPEILEHLKKAAPRVRVQLLDTIFPYRIPADRIVPALIRILEEDSEPLVKSKVLDVLSRYKEKAAPAAAAAARALESRELSVRVLAAEALGQMGSSAYELVRAACSSPRVEVRERALYTLAKIGTGYRTGQTIEILTGSVHDADWTIRRIVFSGIAMIGTPARTCVDLALKGLGDARPEVRSSAANALERLEVVTPDVFAALEKAESDPDPQVRESAGIARTRLAKKK